MVRSVFGKVMWLGRATSALVGLAVLLALGIGAANSALAHTNVDTKLFHLGHKNPVRALSKLTGSVANGVLQVTNQSTDTTTQNATAIAATNNSVSSPAMRATNAGRGTALELNVTCPISSTCFKAAPMKVNSDTKVDNLNSDKLDGQDSSDFMTHDSTLKSGQTLVGVWGVGGAGTTNGLEFAVDAIEFRPKLAAGIPASNMHYVNSATSNCPGEGEAAPGHLCVYRALDTHMSFHSIYGSVLNGWGAYLYFDANSVSANARGTWAVTAP